MDHTSIYFDKDSSKLKQGSQNLRQFQRHLSNEVKRRISANLLNESSQAHVADMFNLSTIANVPQHQRYQLNHQDEKSKLTERSNAPARTKNVTSNISIEKTGAHFEHLLDEINNIQHEVEIAQFKYHGERNLWASTNADLQRQLIELMNCVNKQEDGARKLADIEAEVSKLRSENAHFLQQQRYAKNQQNTIEDLYAQLSRSRQQLEATQKRYTEERYRWVESSAQFEVQLHKLRGGAKSAKMQLQKADDDGDDDQMSRTEVFDGTVKKRSTFQLQQGVKANQGSADFENDFSRLFASTSSKNDQNNPNVEERRFTLVKQELQDKKKELLEVKSQTQKIDDDKSEENGTTKVLQQKLNHAWEENEKLREEVKAAHDNVERLQNELAQNKKERREFAEKLRHQSKEMTDQEKELVELRYNVEQAELEKQAVKDELENVKKDLNNKIKENKNHQRDLQKKLDAIRTKLRQGEESYLDFSKHLDDIVHEATTD